MKDKLAIIVPYRDRQNHLDVFVPHMHEFLKDKGIDYNIFIAEQTDDRPFNYGKLCNAVVNEIGKEYTYFAFHDIDMLPIDDECDYGYPDSSTHLATNVESHNNKLPYPQYFGGVSLINREDFENANGYSNEYWGYGFEDLDLLYRLERSGAYLEKFYDLNNVYSNYDELDIVPYRIENVKISNNKKRNKIHFNNFNKETRVYGSMNPLTRTLPTNSFSISLWFNDDSKRESIKNIFAFEGCDTGIFISKGNEVITQIWDNDEKNYEVIQSYSRNRWNHVVMSYDLDNNKLISYVNNKKQEVKLPDNFTVFDYTNHCIRISDNKTELKISEILLFDSSLNSDVVSMLYTNGNIGLDMLNNKHGVVPTNIFKYNSTYNNVLVLDNGRYMNHLKIEGNLHSNDTIDIPDNLYLPVRLNGKYKSLVHEGDTEIIKKYYKYNPDIEINADIFFHEVLTGVLDYKTLGLNTIKYTILDTQQKENYELIRIVT